MENEPGLTELFLTHTRGLLTPEVDPAVLENLLNRAWEEAHARWPGVVLSPARFVTHLAARLSRADSKGSLPEVLGALSLAELYLAAACVHGIPGAVDSFEQHYLSKLPGQLAYLKLSPTVLDDVCQSTRVTLLVRTPESEPRINDYSGRGALSSWVRVTAVRIALKLLSADRSPQDANMEAVLDALPAPGVDAELDLIKHRHQAEFRQALRDAFAALPSESRHLLRLHFVDKLSTTEIGALLRVNQSTASRWLKTARTAIHDETRRLVQARLNLTANGFESFLAILDSQLDVRISQLFEEEGAPR